MFALRQSLVGYRFYQKLLFEVDQELERSMRDLPRAVGAPVRADLPEVDIARGHYRRWAEHYDAGRFYQAAAEFELARTVFLYLPMTEEVDTRLIAEAAWRDNKVVLVPRCRVSDRTMEAWINGSNFSTSMPSLVPSVSASAKPS